MTTISELQQLAVDLEYRVNQERQASMQDLADLRQHMNAVRSQIENAMAAMNILTDTVEKMFADRTDALAATIGTPPVAETNVTAIGHRS